MRKLQYKLFVSLMILFSSILFAQNTNIENTLNRVKALEGKTAQLLNKVNAANYAMGKANSITNDFNRLNSEVNNAYNALSPLTSVPVLGTPIRVLTTSLNMSKNKLNSANSGLEKIKAPVIDQAAGNASYAKKAVVAFYSYLRKTENDLNSSKKGGGDANNINARLNIINNSLAGVEANFHDME